MFQGIKKSNFETYEVFEKAIPPIENPLLTVICLTHGQEKFIPQALNGFFTQKTSFAFQVAIFDDCSPDQTIHMVLREMASNPRGNLVKYFRQKANLGPYGNGLFALQHVNTKYVALCEGDDYWTDPLKLEKQVDFLERHTCFSVCCHLAYRQKGQVVSKQIVGDFPDRVFTHVDLLRGYPAIPTASFVFRNFSNLADSFVDTVYGGDRALLFFLSRNGKIKVLPFIGSVYREHLGSMESQYRNDNQKLALRNIAENYSYLKRIQPEYRPFMAAKIRWNCFYLVYHYGGKLRLQAASYYLWQTLLFHALAWRLLRTLPPQPRNIQ